MPGPRATSVALWGSGPLCFVGGEIHVWDGWRPQVSPDHTASQLPSGVQKTPLVGGGVMGQVHQGISGNRSEEVKPQKAGGCGERLNKARS
jgi:hypothetical protein